MYIVTVNSYPAAHPRIWQPGQAVSMADNNLEVRKETKTSSFEVVKFQVIGNKNKQGGSS